MNGNSKATETGASAGSLPTVEQNQKYQAVFDYFNTTLFEGRLHSCMLLFTRNARIVGGYFSPERWTDDDGRMIHEIGLNVNIMREQSVGDMLQVVIHEMIHLDQWLRGTSGRMGYHNKEFMSICEQIGLDVEGAGDKVSTSLTTGGLAEWAVVDMPEGLLFDWMASPLDVDGEQGKGSGDGAAGSGDGGKKKSKSGVRVCYQCPVCGAKVWGKGGLSVMCGTDQRMMVSSE
jgi:hypothetical protein